jgi:hypothetical protein
VWRQSRRDTTNHENTQKNYENTQNKFKDVMRRNRVYFVSGNPNSFHSAPPSPCSSSPPLLFDRTSETELVNILDEDVDVMQNSYSAQSPSNSGVEMEGGGMRIG